MKRRSAGLALEESQLILALKYATLIAKNKEGKGRSRAWDMFTFATQSTDMSGLLLSSLQLLSEYVLNELEHSPHKRLSETEPFQEEPLQIEDAITPIAGSVLSPQSFMSKDDCLSNFIGNDSMRSSHRTRGSRGMFSLSISPSGTPDLRGPILREASGRTKRSSEDFFVVSSSTDMQ